MRRLHRKLGRQAVATAAEAQQIAVADIARNVGDAAQGSEEVTNSIGQVQGGAGETGNAALHVLTSAKALSNSADGLRVEVDRFLVSVQSA